MDSLQGKRVAVLVTGGVEEVELTKPVEFLRAKGAKVTVLTPQLEEYERGIKTKRSLDMGEMQRADAVLGDVSADDFDALYIPGGHSPDRLRLVPEAVDFVCAFADKPIFALCHGPQLLISAGLVCDRTLTSWPSIAVDLCNAGATWIDQEVVEDGNLLTSRGPHDIPAFNEAMEDLLAHPGEMGKAA